MAALDAGDYSTAVAELHKAAELAPSDIEFRKDWLNGHYTATNKLLAQAERADAAGDAAKAAASYRDILTFDRHNKQAIAGLETIASRANASEALLKARAALKRKDTEEAMQWTQRALGYAPQLESALQLRREIDALENKDIVSIPSLGSTYRKPINLEFRDAPVRAIFDALSRSTGINFIFDREIRSDQRTTVFLKNTTLADAVDVILATTQLEKKILNSNSVLIYPNTPTKTREYQDLLVKVFYLANAQAANVSTMLKTVLKVKDVYVDDKYNMLVLRERPETIALAEKLVALHDLDEPEVMLEVEVLEVNRSRLQNLGIQFTDQFTITPLSASDTGGAPVSTLKLSDLLNLNSDRLAVTAPSATINIQKVVGDANLLANPRLRVRDREKAEILIGDKVPVVTTTTTPNGFLSENIQYLDVGLKLAVEPQIRLHDEIGLRMSLEVNSLVSTVKTTTGSQAYQIGTRTFSTVLRLNDGETQVLAGLISDAERSSANKVPLLGDVPVLGRLFSSQKDDKQKTEIVLSITPRLIRSMRRNDPATESFWSGTEAAHRNKLLKLGDFDATPDEGAEPPPPATPTVPAVRPIVPNNSGVNLRWASPGVAKLGENVTLELFMDTAHPLRAAPLQLAYNPSQFEVVSVSDGKFFTQDGKGNFNHVLDAAGGRVSVGIAGPDDGVKGSGRLLSIVLKPLVEAPNATVSVIGITPVGATVAVNQPPLPVHSEIRVVK